MVVNETVWSPDTCGCTVSYTWDDAQVSGRTHAFARTISVDATHSGLSGASLFAALQAENSLKNRVPTAAAQTAFLSGFAVDWRQYLPSGAGTVLSGTVFWSFDGVGANRVLVVNTDNIINSSQKTQLQSIINTILGSGRVLVQ